VSSALGHSISALVYAGAIDAEFVRAIQQAKQRQPSLRVIVVTDSDGLRVRQIVGYGIDGVVEKRNLAAALSPTVVTVLAGQAVVPSAQASELFAPSLSHREREVLVLAALGLTNAAIAEKLFLARSTVKTHLTSAFRKLGVSSRNDAATLVLDRETAIGRSLAFLVERERGHDTGVHLHTAGVTPAPADGS